MNKRYIFPSFFSREHVGFSLGKNRDLEENSSNFLQHEYVGFSMFRQIRNIRFKRILLNSMLRWDNETSDLKIPKRGLNSTKNRDLEEKKINKGEGNLTYLKNEHISLQEAFRIFSAKEKDSYVRSPDGPAAVRDAATFDNDTFSKLKIEKLPKDSNSVNSVEKLSPVLLSSLDVTLPKKQTPSMQKTEYKLETFQRSNQDTCLLHKPAVSEGDWVQSGDLLTDCANSVGGDLSLGQNIFIAYMPWEGYNFEDAILISDRLVSEDIFTSVHIERYEIDNIQKNGMSPQERSINKEIKEKRKRKEKNVSLEKNKKEKITVPQTTDYEEITRDIPDVTPEEVSHLDSFGIVKIGSFIEEGDILVGKITPINKKDFTPYQKLLYTILDKQIRPYRDSSLRAPKGINAKVIDIKIFVKPKNFFPGYSSNGEDRATEKNLSLIPSLRNYISTKEKFPAGKFSKHVEENSKKPSRVLRDLGFPRENRHVRSLPLSGKNLESLSRSKRKNFKFLKGIKNTRRPYGLQGFQTPEGSLKFKDSQGLFPFKGNFLFNLKQKRNYLLSLNLHRDNVQNTLGLHTNKSFTKINKMRNILLQGRKPPHSLYTMLGVNATGRTGEKIKILGGHANIGGMSYRKTQDPCPEGATREGHGSPLRGKGPSRVGSPLRGAGIKDLFPSGFFTYDEKTVLRAQNKLSLKKFPQFSQLLSYTRRLKKGPHLVKTLQNIVNGRLKSFKILKKLKKEVVCLNDLNSSVFYRSNKKADAKISKGDISQAPSGILNFFSTRKNTAKSIKDIETIHIYLAEKRKIQVGDKMSGRHGNKGIVSQILPMQDMPFLPDGTPIDLVLNPLGVPSRMNVGQIYECLLGLAGKYLGEHYRISSFDEIYGPEASRSFVFNKLYEARRKTGFNWLFNPEYPGKVRIYDGRSGDCYHQPVTVGLAYMLRLVHMVDDKIHMRSTGPYSLVTQQPLRGRSKQGGQRLGEMEVWALEGYGAAFTLLEMLTVKSDDLTGRMTLWSNLILNKDLSIGTPEAFKVLICELQALCLDIGLFRYNTTKTSPLREDFSEKNDYLNTKTENQFELRRFQQNKSLTEMTSLMSFP